MEVASQHEWRSAETLRDWGSQLIGDRWTKSRSTPSNLTKNTIHASYRNPALPFEIAVKAMNDIRSESGLVSSRIVFVFFRRFNILSADPPQHKERMEALKTAQSGMNSIIAEHRVQEAALTNNICASADWVYKLSKEVLIYSETKKGWLGPLEVVPVQGRMVTVQNEDKSIR